MNVTMNTPHEQLLQDKRTGVDVERELLHCNKGSMLEKVPLQQPDGYGDMVMVSASGGYVYGFHKTLVARTLFTLHVSNHQLFARYSHHKL
jgi:hypothetical protein